LLEFSGKTKDPLQHGTGAANSGMNRQFQKEQSKSAIEQKMALLKWYDPRYR